jgi:hypothetical protein
MMALAVALGALLGGALLTTPASAQVEHYPTTGWEVRDASGTYPDIEWNPAAASQIIDAYTVDLTKPAGDIGTSIETTNLGVDVEAGDVITVHYELKDGAAVDDGAIRMFYYDHPDGDTIHVGPTAFVAADGSGTLQLQVLADGTIGTFGLTYDATNASAGTVTFSSLKINEELVRFIEPVQSSPAPATASPTAVASPTPSASPTPGATAEPSTTPSAAPSAEAAPELPVTGSNLTVVLGGVAVLLGLAGGGLMALARRRRTTFRVE